MKESPSSNYPNLIFREVFRSEQETRKNGGTPTDVDFANGKGTFNGTSSKVNYNLGLNGTYSVRVRCNPTSFAENNFIFDFRGSNSDGAGSLYLSSTTGTIQASGTKYRNGIVDSTTVLGANNEIIVTGITLTQGTGANLSLIGSNYINTNEFLGTMDLVEIYSGTLTASEVSNLYNDRWNTELPPTTPREVTQFSCDLNVSGWQRCADNNATDSGGTYGAGKSLKAVGSGNGTDDIGFSGLLSGYRNTNGSFYNLGSYLRLWSSTPSGSSNAWRRAINASYSTVRRDVINRGHGFSVRCLRDTDDTSDFTDPRDGTVYQCVRIGTQVWMTKNLAYLPSVNAAADNSTDDPMYYVYGYDGTDVATAKALSNYTEYGVLYNHPAAIISAPTGFHVPSDEELNVLELATLEVIAETAGDDLMTILNDGNVGIGTTNPGALLHLQAASGASSDLRFTDTTNSKSWHIGNANNDDFVISETAVADRLTIKAGGNVGIGTTNPSEKLDVNGNIKATQYKLSDLNTAPSSSSDTGTKGEIRVTADAIYICSATDTWVKTDLATF